MYETQGDFLLTYGPSCYEEHDDSTDFEENRIPNVGSRKGNHSLLNIQGQQPPRSVHHQNDMYEDYDKYPVKLRNVNHKFSGTEVQIGLQRVKIKGKNLNRADSPSISTHTIHSKLSVLKDKLIPCISSLFKRSIKKDRKGTPIEYPMDNHCQRCSYCERRRVRKIYKRQNYAVQPVYALEGIHKTQAPFGQTKITEEPLKSRDRKKFTNQYSACNLSSSSESESQLVKARQQKVRHFKRKLKSEFVKERLKYQQNQHLKNQYIQFPPKNKSPYQIFSSSCHHSVSSRISHDSGIKYLTDMPSSSSGFWDYLFDKFNKKYTTQRLELPKHCKCVSSQATCTPETCNFRAKENTGPLPKNLYPDKREKKKDNHICECTQLPDPEETASTGTQAGHIPESPCTFYRNNEKTTSEDNGCPQTNTMKSGPEGSKPCQEDHGEITAALAEKYNGEILCIHNPPCILINGCLNLPSPKSQPQTELWPVTETKKTGFCEGYRKKKAKAKWEQACQYLIPYVDVRQCQIPEYKTDKIVQSVCNHNPPCEIVRGCFKPKYDPTLQNSCIHVPMCSKIPECAMGQPEVTCCEHRPRCQNIPLCSRNRNYAVLTARETVGMQARPRENLVCRHAPPCIMIPKCLGRAMYNNCVPFDAIPGCDHQPPCEMMPACCRKATKEMVSASSQYPNSCRIV